MWKKALLWVPFGVMLGLGLWTGVEQALTMSRRSAAPDDDLTVFGRHTAVLTAASLRKIKDECLSWYRTTSQTGPGRCLFLKKELERLKEWSRTFEPLPVQAKKDMAEVERAIAEYSMFFGEVGI